MSTCTVGIVTYKRRTVLQECLRCLEKQTRLPNEIKVVDASDDSEETEALLRKEFASFFEKVPLIFVKSPKGITRQRNIAADGLTTDVLIYLDDDTLVFPEYVENVMRIFEADTKKIVGGVEGTVVLDQMNTVGHKGSLKQKLQTFLNFLRIKWIGPFYPPHLLSPVVPVPQELNSLSIAALRNLYGCVMSYRTALVQKYRFNENLKLYSFLEDFDLSYRIGKHYALVRCAEARAYHLRAEGGRLDPSLVHYMYLINVAYIGRISLDPEPGLYAFIEAHAQRFAKAEYPFGFLRRSKFSQYRGAYAGYLETKTILSAPQEQLDAVYAEVLHKGLEKKVF